MKTINFNKEKNLEEYEESVQVVANHIKNEMLHDLTVVDYLLNENARAGVVAFAVSACSNDMSEIDALNLSVMMDNRDKETNLVQLDENKVVNLGPFTEFVSDVVREVGVVEFEEEE